MVSEKRAEASDSEKGFYSCFARIIGPPLQAAGKAASVVEMYRQFKRTQEFDAMPHASVKSLHVIEFNLFVSALLVGTAAAVLAVVWFHRPGDRITREELIDDKSDEQ